MEIEVKGHSGCSIEITRRDKVLYIEKGTCDPKYVERLYKQALKQQRAKESKTPFIRIPEIYKINKTASSMSMQMEYIYSKNFIDYFETSGFEQVTYFVNTISQFVLSEVDRSPVQDVPCSVLQDKFNDVKRIIFSNKNLVEREEIPQLIKLSEAVFSNLPASLSMPIGICHGDLTLSNILFNTNYYYLIDFLDSFIESPLMDMVKLRQDTAHCWSLLMYEGDFDRTRFKIIANKIDFELDRLFSQYDWYVQYYHLFQLMNLLRVLQYAHEERVINYLTNEIYVVLKFVK